MAPELSVGPLDRYFAALMQRLSGSASSELELASSLVSRAQFEGNVCLQLTQVAAEADSKTEDFATKLKASEVVGAPGDLKPLILDSANRLYLRRYWEYEQSLAKAIRDRLETSPPKVDTERLTKNLDRLFPEKDPTDGQRLAAYTAVTRNFCVITGGPGTGKTHTVLTILALLLEQAGKPLRLALAAPSGKAAIRLQESMQHGKEGLDCPAQIKAWMPNEAATIHRLLGAIPESAYFRHDAEHQLLADAVIVDEASMIDLATMAKLFAATPLTARMILLGDKDQLASVEAGSVLGDICRDSAPPPPQANDSTGQLAFTFEQRNSNSPLRDSIIELHRNYRFSAESGIYQLVQAVNGGESDQVFAILKDSSSPDLAWKPLPDRQSLTTALAKPAANGFAAYLRANNPLEALNRLGDFRILCAIRRGPFGVENINLLAEEALARKELLEKTGQWYRGRPVMVTRNDYHLRLFNGDIGIILDDPESAEKRAWFNSVDGRPRQILPTRLPAHETAFAITVHKSQGSEFGKVLLILPETDSPLLTRELLYTALTRARDAVEIWAPEKVLRAAIGRQVTRNSGLRDALSG